MITKRTPPHGSVSTHGIKDQQTREAMMKINENTALLLKMVEELQNAVIELQRKKV